VIRVRERKLGKKCVNKVHGWSNGSEYPYSLPSVSKTAPRSLLSAESSFSLNKKWKINEEKLKLFYIFCIEYLREKDP
jgi:hypothetical protein